MNAVLLHESRGDFGERLLAEEGQQMDAKPVLMALHIDGLRSPAVSARNSRRN